MHVLRTFILVGTATLAGAPPQRSDPAAAAANPNVERAGVLRDGVLSVALEAKMGQWHPNGDDHPGLPIAVFAADGRAPLIPGPLIRATVGTELRVTVRNTLPLPITFFLPTAIRGQGSGTNADSIAIAAGAVATLTTRATMAGNYAYRAMTPGTPRPQLISGQLTGGVVIDSAGTPASGRDRVFVITEAFVPDHPAADSTRAAGAVTGHVAFMLNGLSWPNTEHLDATAGDSLHWRIINASPEQHPMHLHGFYFHVDDYSPPSDDRVIRGAPGRTVVTERLAPLSGMQISWFAGRAGNWIFHCHFALHMVMDARPDSPGDRATTGMGGLVLAVAVAARAGASAVAPQAPKRHLRLLAVRDAGFPDSEPSMRFMLEERGRRVEAGTAFSPAIELTRGEPVSIMVVNQLAEPTAVHWHGIELESYNDGVAGVSGSGAHVASAIAPRDSFEVRFTPPRSGTFIYHSHFDEVRQQRAGLAGALIVRDRGAVPSTADHIFFLKASRQPNAPSPLDVNGRANPDTLVLRIDEPTRLRFISLAAVNPTATVSLTARPDSSFANLADRMIVRWRALAKDGADLPAGEQVTRAAQQLVSMGETFDFEYTPVERGTLRLEVRAYGAAGTLLARVPIVVK